MINYPYIPPNTADKKAITPTGMLTAKSTKPESVLLLENNWKFLLKNKNNFISSTCPCPCQLVWAVADHTERWRDWRNTPARGPQPHRRPDWAGGGDDWSTWWLQLNWAISPPSALLHPQYFWPPTYPNLYSQYRLLEGQQVGVCGYFANISVTVRWASSLSFTQFGCSIMSAGHLGSITWKLDWLLTNWSSQWKPGLIYLH